uniref:Uncharacterized protein n=1 Tax=Romanomermis culicivorax TaxID=13658 RepID=A0A915KFK1_ROMCU
MEKKHKSAIEAIEKDDSGSNKRAAIKFVPAGSVIYMLPSFNEPPDDEVIKVLSDIAPASSSPTKQVCRDKTDRRKRSSDDRTLKVKRTHSMLMNKSFVSAVGPSAEATDIAKLKLTLPSIGASFGTSDKSTKCGEANRTKNVAAENMHSKINAGDNISPKCKNGTTIGENFNFLEPAFAFDSQFLFHISYFQTTASSLCDGIAESNDSDA